MFSVTSTLLSDRTSISEWNLSKRLSFAEAEAQRRDNTQKTLNSAVNQRCGLLRTGIRSVGGANQAVGAAGLPKLTLGASRSAAEETSKNSRCLKPSMPAIMLLGNCRILVFKSRTTAL